MTDINENVVTEAVQQGESLLAEDFVELIERHHPHEQPGVSRETIDQYTDALAVRDETDFDADGFTETLDSRLTDAETWQGHDALYALNDDRVSTYPANWHEALGGSTDVREYIRFLLEAENFENLESGGAGYGVPQKTLLDIVAVVGRTDREAAKARLEELRDSGEVIEDADQHPDARVRLAE